MQTAPNATAATKTPIPRVERARERQEPPLPRPVEDRLVPLPGRVRLLVQLVEVAVSTSMVMVSGVYVWTFSAWAPVGSAAP